VTPRTVNYIYDRTPAKKYIEQERVYCHSTLDYAGSNDANAPNDEK